MIIQEIMTSDVACCTPETNLQEVSQMMSEHDCGAIPVVENTRENHPIGMVTDRDITVRLVANGQNPVDRQARDAMTEASITVRSDADVSEAERLMKEHQVRRLMVIEDGGACCGIVAQADLALNTSDRVTGDVVEEISESGSRAQA